MPLTAATAAGQAQATTGSLIVSDCFKWVLPDAVGRFVEASPNLQAWIPVQTNASPPGRFRRIGASGANPKQFFRERLAP